jgi:hypothetical protein
VAKEEKVKDEIEKLSPAEAYWKGKYEGLEKALEEIKNIIWHLQSELMVSRPLVSGAQASLIHVEAEDILSWIGVAFLPTGISIILMGNLMIGVPFIIMGAVFIISGFISKLTKRAKH